VVPPFDPRVAPTNGAALVFFIAKVQHKVGISGQHMAYFSWRWLFRCSETALLLAPFFLLATFFVWRVADDFGQTSVADHFGESRFGKCGPR
jgi:hypothetical protein